MAALLSEEEPRKPAPPSQAVAISSLLALLFFSPCEAFLPIYLSVAAHGWIGFIILSAVLAGGTILGMITFTWMTITGLDKVHLQPLEKFERGLTGILLSMIGAIILFLPH